jgi:hypothetical protein
MLFKVFQLPSVSSTTYLFPPLIYLNQAHCMFRHQTAHLFDPNHPLSDPNERCHFWIPDSSLTSSTELLDTPVSERMYIERDEVVRVRVECDEFYDDEPGPPKLTEGVQVKREPSRAPYSVCVSKSLVCILSIYLLTIFLSIYEVFDSGTGAWTCSVVEWSYTSRRRYGSELNLFSGQFIQVKNVFNFSAYFDN